ncbi:hypothetical protein [Vibrio sp. YYF0003]|uniref:hypothetical protein n=1 Tax=Vibrio sp. YYF0003 TaxID=3116646 RepID=UPI002EB4099C|nr:hypothetical protein [Vibrio sp. YYF0003]
MTKNEQNQQSVQSLFMFLLEVITTPADFAEDELLLKALNSQGGLARYENISRGITPCALNTQKTNADEVLSDMSEVPAEKGGYDKLNFLRQSAKNQLDKEQDKDKELKPGRRTKGELQRLVSELEEDLAIVEQHNLMMIALLSNLMNTTANYVKTSGNSQLQADWLEERKAISAKTSFINNQALLRSMSEGRSDES